jgi:hypothetical protein
LIPLPLVEAECLGDFTLHGVQLESSLSCERVRLQQE